MDIQTAGVVGAGVMGVGVAQNLAQCGMDVVLVDISEAVLERARNEIGNNVRFQGFFAKEKNGPSPEEVLGRIVFTTEPEKLAEVDYLVENVVEKWPVKEEVYRRIDPLCKPSCVFAANTSAISITRIASVTKRPDRVIGMHFMNPVPMKPMVEVIRGFHTSEETIAFSKFFLKKMGKSCVVVNDSPGFVSNRVLMLTVNEAVFLVAEGVAKAEEVDRIFKSCFGHKMGPLETADLIGLDTILYSLDVLYESFNDSKFRPCPLLKKMVDAGLHGRKNGRGFYDYPVL
ncbi:MAG: 3-hydroxybutyryl-CoA dehydrogenase [Magnetococcales bacterium]|nr:3-hydroxybutyryl-CoA dehydrogenase [Magnetococcales bacterium]MBF0262216.1 3-hydroxybutyryl-CoA dehydrogenase [Magnetococcales bacterium]